MAAFARARGYHDGMNAQCRPCRRKADLESYYRRRDEVAARLRQRYYENLEASRARRRAAALRWNRKHGVKPKRYIRSDAERIERKKEYQATYAARHPLKVLASKRAYEARYPERVTVAKANNKAKRKAAPGVVTSTEWKRILLFYGQRCAVCRNGGPLTVDHFVPITRHGTHEWTNVWPLCLRCNLAKGTRMPTEAAPPHVAALMRSEGRRTG